MSNHQETYDYTWIDFIGICKHTSQPYNIICEYIMNNIRVTANMTAWIVITILTVLYSN
jgi:hypothetical protein